jgi:hypothetical protein
MPEEMHEFAIVHTMKSITELDLHDPSRAGPDSQPAHDEQYGLVKTWYDRRPPEDTTS